MYHASGKGTSWSTELRPDSSVSFVLLLENCRKKRQHGSELWTPRAHSVPVQPHLTCSSRYEQLCSCSDDRLSSEGAANLHGAVDVMLDTKSASPNVLCTSPSSLAYAEIGSL